MMTLGQIMAWLGAGQLHGDPNLVVYGVNTDTRKISQGDLFVALKGDRFDGNLLLNSAKASGAKAALANSSLLAADFSGIEVSDTKLALGLLAKGWRKQFDLPLIAVTGSNGKTTVTQMISSILRAYKKANAFSTIGNLNNDIGVPLTLLRLSANHEIAVVELGMNHPGEIHYLAQIACPTVALVNNAQREHLEFMKTVEAVANENGAVITSLPEDGIAVFPADDDYASVWRNLARGKRVLTFSQNADIAADVSCTKVEWTSGKWHVQSKTPIGLICYELHIPGWHNVKNSLAAIACACAAGVSADSIRQGLEAFRPVAGRSNTLSVSWQGRDVVLVDDSYNANPDSMKAAVEVLSALEGPCLLVMGDMGEVGEQGIQFHTEVGALVESADIEKLFTYGALAKEASLQTVKGQHFEDIETLNIAVLQQMDQVKSILVKGSRFMKMERVVEAILSSQTNHTNHVKKKGQAYVT